MQRSRDTVLHRLGRKRSLRYWATFAARTDGVGLKLLSEQARLARRLRGDLDRVIAVADLRAGALHRPPDPPDDVDWAWIPDAWGLPLSPAGLVQPGSGTDFGNGVRLFHDSATTEITLRQVRAAQGYAVMIETYRFAGSFLSLAVTLPPAGLVRLSRTDLVGLRGVLRMERPVEVFARLNLHSGPNTETEVFPVVLEAGGRFLAEFDMQQIEANVAATNSLWIDLIFGAPEMNAIDLSGLTATRRPRAAL